jgi:hypothetical protein
MRKAKTMGSYKLVQYTDSGLRAVRV